MKRLGHRSTYLLALGLLALAAERMPGQVAETPEQVAGRYMRAMAAQQWDTMAALMHPAGLHQLRSLLAPLFEAPSMDGARQDMLGVQSLKEAQDLSDTRFFAAFISHLLHSQPAVMDILRDSKTQMIGHVPEGSDTVHVVYRMNYEKDGVGVSKLDVFSMQRMGSTWRGLPNGDFRLLGAMLRRQARS